MRVGLKIIDKIFDITVVVIFGMVITYGIYAFHDGKSTEAKADVKNYQIYKPTEDNTLSFEELQNINPDVIGWITVYDTNIDYPFAQSEESTKYVNTDVYGNFSLSGCLFLDSSNSSDFSNYNNIIYGHHMDKNRMFGDIESFSDKEYFDSHRYGNIYYNGTNHSIEFFAFLYADAYDEEVYRTGQISEGNKTSHLDYLKGLSVNYRDIEQSGNLILLSTCNNDSTNGRSILVGVITADTTHENSDKNYSVNPNIIFYDKVITKPIINMFQIILIIIVVVSAFLLIVKSIKKKRKQ